MSLSNNEREFLLNAALGKKDGPFIPKRELLDIVGNMANWITSHSTKFWLTLLAVPGAGVRTAQVKLAVYDASSIQNVFDQTSYCTVSITGGGAAGKKINGVAGPLVITMVDGEATIEVSATGVGTAILGLSLPSPAGLAVASTATVTFS